MVFVFGSNLSGIRGAGAAHYALPTKGINISFMPFEEVKAHIEEFKEFALKHPNVDFQVTQVGCGLAGFTKEQIAPLFKSSPSNCYFDMEWQPLLGDSHNYWV